MSQVENTYSQTMDDLSQIRVYTVKDAELA